MNQYEKLQAVHKKSSQLCVNRNLTSQELAEHKRFMDQIDKSILYPERVPEEMYERLLAAYERFLQGVADGVSGIYHPKIKATPLPKETKDFLQNAYDQVEKVFGNISIEQIKIKEPNRE